MTIRVLGGIVPTPCPWASVPKRGEAATNINASIVDQQVAGVVETHPEWFPAGDENMRKSAAFVLLCMANALDLPREECAELLTDGGNDAGVDGLHTGDVEDGGFVVTIFQGKYRVGDLEGSANFPENGVQKAMQTVEALFDPNRTVALNPKIRPLIEEIRSLIRDGYIPTVRVVLCNNGARWTAQADRWVQEAKRDWGEQVEFLHFNHDAVVRSLQRGPRVDAVLTLSGEIVAEDLNFKRVLVGRISVQELHRLFEEHGDRLLERNIRRYLGQANRVNADIRATLLDANASADFYFYNNGITVVCDRLDYNALQKFDYRVQLKNLQVINGGQTCRVIHQTLSENVSCAPDAHLLIRIYQLPEGSAEVVQAITKATNSQSPVDLRDLRSNDEWQRTLGLGMAQLGYAYRRHREEGGTGAGEVTSAGVAEAVLAVWRERPHQAKFRRPEHFGRLYDLIFQDLNAAQALIATLIYRAVERRRKDGAGVPPDYVAYASHHLAMMIGREMLGDLSLTVEEVSHRSFTQIRDALIAGGDRYYALAMDALAGALRACYGDREVSLQQLAATFRRGDLLEMLDAAA